MLKIMWNIDWSKISSCTLEDRKKLIPYIIQLLDLKNACDEQGVYGLEEFLNSSTNSFEKIALQLIIQGYMPEMCEVVLFDMLNSSNIENDQYLKNVIFAAFVLLIQKEPIDNRELKIRLSAYLGVECVGELLN